MLAHSQYKNLPDRKALSAHYFEKNIMECWNSIHMYSTSMINDYSDFKPVLERQWYTIHISVYNNHKELIDSYLDFLVRFGLPIKYEVSGNNLIIDVIIDKLNSLAERKLTSYLIRHIGSYTTGYYKTLSTSIFDAIDIDIPVWLDTTAILPTIMELYKQFPKMSRLKCILLGNMITQRHLIFSNHTIFYNPLGEFLVPKYTSVKEFWAKIKIRETPAESASSYCMHKHFSGIANTSKEANEIKVALVKKDFKKALKIFNEVNQIHKQTQTV